MKNYLYFNVLEAPVSANSQGEVLTTDKYKALIREDTGDILGIVGSQYFVIQNKPLYDAIDQVVEAADVGSYKVRNHALRQGDTVMREYIFNDISTPSLKTSMANIRFRIIALNGFGTIPVKIMTGGIDFYCLNGMLLGENIHVSIRRHTRMFDLLFTVDQIKEAIETFRKQGEEWRKWQKMPVSIMKVDEFIDQTFGSKRLIDALKDRCKVEYADRGQNLWAVYSGLTYWASHNKGVFSVSDKTVENNNVSGILFHRSQRVKQIVNSPNWYDLAA